MALILINRSGSSLKWSFQQQHHRLGEANYRPVLRLSRVGRAAPISSAATAGEPSTPQPKCDRDKAVFMAMHLERVSGRTVAAMAVLLVLAAVVPAFW